MRLHRCWTKYGRLLFGAGVVLFGVVSGSAQNTQSPVVSSRSQSKPPTSVTGTKPASSTRDPFKTGFFAGLIFPYHNIGGDFKGTTFLFDKDQVVLFPKVKPSVGFGIAAGGRLGYIDVEVSWSFSESKGTFGDFKPKTKYYVFTVGSKMLFPIRSRVRPFLDAGWGILKLVVRDGSFPVDPAEPEFWTANSRFSWAFKQFGGGVAFQANSRLRFQLGFLYRFSSFGDGDIEGVAGVIYPPRSIKANALIVTFGPSYVF